MGIKLYTEESAKKQRTVMTCERLMQQSLELEQSIYNVINKELKDRASFKQRTFYAEAFFAFYLSKKKRSKRRSLALFSYAVDNNSSDCDFHWEFVILALLGSKKYVDVPDEIEKKIRDADGHLKFKGTCALNWFLMRQLCTLLDDPSVKPKVLTLILAKFKKYQTGEEVLFEDQKNDKSHQYHAYILALLIEINSYLESDDVSNLIHAGTQYLIKRQFLNGRAMYRGRGQEQIFGYACYLFLLAHAFGKTNDHSYLYHYKITLHFIRSFQTKELGLPLVLNEFQKQIPMIPDLKSTEFTGWYTYNNHFDYLAFFLSYLEKANNIFKSVETLPDDLESTHPIKYQYQMEPGSKLYSNDISFPLIYDVIKKDFITTVMGGEQYSPSINSEKDLLFPYVRRLTGSLWSYAILIYKRKTKLIYITPIGFVVRTIIPDKDKLTIISKVWSPINVCFPIVLSEPYTKLIDNQRYKFDGFVYTPLGKFFRFYERGRSQKFVVRFNK